MKWFIRKRRGIWWGAFLYSVLYDTAADLNVAVERHGVFFFNQREALTTGQRWMGASTTGRKQ